MDDATNALIALQRHFREKGDYTSFTLNAKAYMPGYNIFSLLDYFFDKIPDSQKFAVVLDVYTITAENNNRRILKYLKAVKPLIPAEVKDIISALADSNGEIMVYRGGQKSKDASRRVSWTTSVDIAEFFAKRYLYYNGFRDGGGKAVVYTGVIKPQDVIAYTNGRKEKEIIQYCSVKRVQVVKTIDKLSESDKASKNIFET